MSNPGENLGELERLAKSSVWQLLTDVLTTEMNKALVPPSVTGTMDAIAIATISRSATYTALTWVRDKMLGEVIEREKRALAE